MEEIKQMFTKIINTNSQQDTKITQLSENVTKLTESVQFLSNTFDDFKAQLTEHQNRILS